MSIYKKSALQIHQAFMSGELTAVQIIEHFLKRIEKFDGETTAFLKVLSKRSLEKARELDLKKKGGKTYAVKKDRIE